MYIIQLSSSCNYYPMCSSMNRRQKAVCDDGEEKEQYGQLTLDFMSEESSSDETVITIHRPEWRSDSKWVFVKMPTMEVC